MWARWWWGRTSSGVGWRTLGDQITADYADRPPLLVGVLKGAFVFMSDLAKVISLPVEIDLMAIASYGSDTTTSGVVRIMKDLDSDLEGATSWWSRTSSTAGSPFRICSRYLLAHKPATVEVCALLVKEGLQRTKSTSATSASPFRPTSSSATASMSTSATGTCPTCVSTSRAIPAARPVPEALQPMTALATVRWWRRRVLCVVDAVGSYRATVGSQDSICPSCRSPTTWPSPCSSPSTTGSTSPSRPARVGRALAPFDVDVVVSVATMGIPLAIEVTRALGLDDYLILQKTPKIHLQDAIDEPVTSITTGAPRSGCCSTGPGCRPRPGVGWPWSTTSSRPARRCAPPSTSCAAWGPMPVVIGAHLHRGRHLAGEPWATTPTWCTPSAPSRSFGFRPRAHWSRTGTAEATREAAIEEAASVATALDRAEVRPSSTRRHRLPRS